MKISVNNNIIGNKKSKDIPLDTFSMSSSILHNSEANEPSITGILPISNIGAEFDTEHDETEHLVINAKSNLKVPSLVIFLRILLITFLIGCFIIVLTLIIKESWFLKHQRRILNPQLLDISEADACFVNPSFRFDCHPSKNATEDQCIRRGCCWDTKVTKNGQPYCYFTRNASFYDWSKPFSTPQGYQLNLTLKTTGILPPYPNPVKNLQVLFNFENVDTLRIKIVDADSQRYEVPLEYTNSPRVNRTNVYIKFMTNGFRIYRKGTSYPLFDSTVGPLIFADQFLQISTRLPFPWIYGLGENEDSFRRNLDWTRSVLWNHDTVPKENTNLYGSHPFYFGMEKEGSAHGVFLANSNAMEILLQPAPAVTFRTIGGIFDFYIYTGPSPGRVMEQYTRTVGRPFLPPYWSLGFHLCRFNYKNLEDTKEILFKNLDKGIPIDVQWNDLDYMKNRNDFTLDPAKFSELPEFVKWLHQNGMHYVPLIDPGISGGEKPGSYPPYDYGLKEDIFIKNSKDKKPFVGKVWNPNSTVWPDFTHPNSSHYWMTLFENFHSMVEFDGAWIDMNEPSNFWDGTKDGNCDLDSTLDYPPYVPNVEGGKLNYKTICPSAQQFLGSHYNLHNLYGVYETIVTNRALGDIRSERQFVISRSTFPGQGHFGGHWTGDVNSSWDHLKKSIPQILNFGLYGIPMVGADICGFNGNTTVNLCRRWHQLGAFYPFSRNHNTDDGVPQDPASLGDEVVRAAKETLDVRYSLLPYLYTLFFNANLFGQPVARPLFFEFPMDVRTFFIQDCFMWGKAVLFVPILDDGEHSQVSVYLPRGWWYPHYEKGIIESFGEIRRVPVPENSIPILYREGTAVFRQRPSNNTVFSRLNPFSLHVYLTSEGIANGELFWDDGISPNPRILRTFNHFIVESKTKSLKITNAHNGYPDGKYFLDFIEIRGILSSVSSVTINKVPWRNWSLDSLNRRLLISSNGTPSSFSDGLSIEWNF